MANKDITVIGGSTGSGQVLKRLMSDLPGDMQASLFIATHVPMNSLGYLAESLAGCGPLPVSAAVDGQPIEKGHVYVAVPDRHLLVVDGTMRLGDGPRENMTRPAIDPLFRSAALSYGPRTVGVVITGLLNDGASGLAAIKACGGTAVVQHPLDAEADQMPLAALETVAIDEVAAARDLGRLLAEISRRPAGEALDPPVSLQLEVEIAAGSRLGSEELGQFADPTALTCPNCSGVLSEIRNERPLRFRCQTGHALTADVLETRHQEVEHAMRVALRVMEERLTLVTRMARDARATGRDAVAELYESRACEYSAYAETLRRAAIRTMHPATEDSTNKA